MQHARGDQQTPAKLQAVDFDLANAGDRRKNALGLMVVARFSIRDQKRAKRPTTQGELPFDRGGKRPCLEWSI